MLPNIPDPTEYGLPFSDYDSQGVIDPTTEQNAAQYERHAVDCAAMGHTAARAIVRVAFSGSTPAVVAYDSVWGSDPALRPTLTDFGTGNTHITWAPGGYPDLNPTAGRRLTVPPSVRFVQVQQLTGGFNTPTWDSNSVTVQTYDHTAAAADIDFIVWVY